MLDIQGRPNTWHIWRFLVWRRGNDWEFIKGSLTIWRCLCHYTIPHHSFPRFCIDCYFKMFQGPELIVISRCFRGQKGFLNLIRNMYGAEGIKHHRNFENCSKKTPKLEFPIRIRFSSIGWSSNIFVDCLSI